MRTVTPALMYVCSDGDGKARQVCKTNLAALGIELGRHFFPTKFTGFTPFGFWACSHSPATNTYLLIFEVQGIPESIKLS